MHYAIKIEEKKEKKRKKKKKKSGTVWLSIPRPS
jgi:hypothetical protein